MQGQDTEMFSVSIDSLDRIDARLYSQARPSLVKICSSCVQANSSDVSTSAVLNISDTIKIPSVADCLEFAKAARSIARVCGSEAPLDDTLVPYGRWNTAQRFVGADSELVQSLVWGACLLLVGPASSSNTRMDDNDADDDMAPYSLHGVETVVSSIYSTGADVRVASLEALWMLSRFDENVAALYTCGIVNSLRVVLHNIVPPAHALLDDNSALIGQVAIPRITDHEAAPALKVLHNLCFDAGVCQKLVLESDITSVILPLLERGSDEQRTMAALAVQSLAGHGDDDARIACHVLVPALLALARTGDEHQKDKSAAALRNIAVAPPSQVFLALAGAIEPMLSLVCAPSGTFRSEAVNTLRNIASSSGNQTLLANPDVIAPVLRLMGSDSAEERAGAAAFVRNLSGNSRGRIVLSECNAPQVLLNMLRGPASSDEKIQVAAAFRNLSLLRYDAETTASPPLASLDPVEMVQVLLPLVGEENGEASEHASFAVWNVSTTPESELLVAQSGLKDTIVKAVGYSAQSRLDAAATLYNDVVSGNAVAFRSSIQCGGNMALACDADSGDTVLHAIARSLDIDMLDAAHVDPRFDWLLEQVNKGGERPVDCLPTPSEGIAILSRRMFADAIDSSGLGTGTSSQDVQMGVEQLAMNDDKAEAIDVEKWLRVFRGVLGTSRPDKAACLMFVWEQLRSQVTCDWLNLGDLPPEVLFLCAQEVQRPSCRLEIM